LFECVLGGGGGGGGEELLQLTCEWMGNVYSVDGTRSVHCRLKFDAFVRTMFYSERSKCPLIERLGEMCDLILRNVTETDAH